MTKHLQSCKNHMANAAVHFLYKRENSNDNLFHVSKATCFSLYEGGKKILKFYFSQVKTI